MAIDPIDPSITPEWPGGHMRFRTMLIAFVVLVLAVAAFAQKQPKEYWTVNFLYQDGTNVVGGRGVAEAETIYDPRVYPAGIMATAAEEIVSGKNPSKRSAFRFYLENPNPTASKELEASSAYEWITFQNVELCEGCSIPVSPLPGRSCFMPGIENPLATDYPNCKIAFMNKAPHPQQHYGMVGIDVVFRGIGFLSDLRVGDTFEPGPKSLPSLGIGIWSKRDCEDPQYTGIGIAPASDPQFSATTIMRVSDNEWRIDVSQRVKLLDFGYRQETYTLGKKTYTDCRMYVGGDFTTKPMKFSMIWTRHLQ